jgi:hypothetical protein
MNIALALLLGLLSIDEQSEQEQDPEFFKYLQKNDLVT